MKAFPRILFALGILFAVPGLDAQDAQPSTADQLAQKLANPVSSLISVPFDSSFDFGYDNDGYRITTNIQPVVPIQVSEDWNVIWRTILPVVYQEDVIGDSSQTGLSDTLLSLFLSPVEATETGITWGVGPVFYLPTATDDLLGTEKWGAGPTAVVLRQDRNLTYGALVNHVWSYAGEDARGEVNASFIQPFLAVGLGGGYNVTVSSEATYDWEQSEWNIPINLFAAKVFQIGGQKVQLQVGGGYFADAPEGGPEWGLRLKLTFLFPK